MIKPQCIIGLQLVIQTLSTNQKQGEFAIGKERKEDDDIQSVTSSVSPLSTSKANTPTGQIECHSTVTDSEKKSISKH
jgi:hypothetical protein